MQTILYSFRRCPYAIRARMALKYSGLEIHLREVVLKDKPDEMLKASSKGTVPVLLLPSGQVIDESLSIMHWALEKYDPEQWLIPTLKAEIETLIFQNDYEFKPWLDKYKYADRHPEHNKTFYREHCEIFLQQLEEKLSNNDYLLTQKQSLADIAIFPFIRQCAYVDKTWFEQAPYPNLNRWLNSLLKSTLFLSTMDKHSKWSAVKDNSVLL